MVNTILFLVSTGCCCRRTIRTRACRGPQVIGSCPFVPPKGSVSLLARQLLSGSHLHTALVREDKEHHLGLYARCVRCLAGHNGCEGHESGDVSVHRSCKFSESNVSVTALRPSASSSSSSLERYGLRLIDRCPSSGERDKESLGGRAEPSAEHRGNQRARSALAQRRRRTASPCAITVCYHRSR